MEKTHDTPASVILSKTKDGYEKIILNLNFQSALTYVCCFLFSHVSFFSGMSPLGLAFYTAVFSKNGWVLNYIISCITVFISGIPSPWVYVCAFTLITSLLAIVEFDFGKFSLSIVSSLSFFALKIFALLVSEFIWYDFFALILETVLIFITVYIFKKSLPVITSVSKRNFISTLESICTMCFFALVSLALSSFPKVLGFNISNVLSILMIYIFASGGINGGAVVLGVLMGAFGSLDKGSFALITSSFSFGALLSSFFSYYGKLGVILGFVVANTASYLILSTGAYIDTVIYDSLAAALLFFFVPQKTISYFSSVFTGHTSVCDNETSLVKRTQRNIEYRLGEMSRSFRELSDVYASSAPTHELGRDYIASKFKLVTDSACIGCPSKNKCFKNSDAKGYYHMTKMLETAFKNGKVSLSDIPGDFRTKCRRCDSFLEKFNSVYNIIKTEKQWLSKLNDSRRLISDQLSAVANALDYEKEKCMLHIDRRLEEELWAEFDKTNLYPSNIVAQTDYTGDFCITVSYNEKNLTQNTLYETQHIISSYVHQNISCDTPIRRGNDVVYSFYPAGIYTITSGYASKVKDGETVSGDSFKIIKSKGRRYTAILSDGMGSGKKALEESKTTVSLMEKFLRLGYDSDTSVRLINSSLLLKSSRDSFSTIDLCTVDLSDATVTFTKLGAVKSYIKTDDTVTEVTGTGLPAGILREIEIESRLLSISSDTLIILISDGVADISLKNTKLDGWIEKELLKINTTNPQIIASRLIEKAVSLTDGIVHDDMTVIALQVKKV